MNKKYSLKRLLEAGEIHIFDFDDTLGITNAMTIVAAAEKINGKMVPVKNLKLRLKNAGIIVKSPSELSAKQLGDHNSYLTQSETLTVGPDALIGAEPVVIDTHAYAAWKNDYIGSTHQRAVVRANDDKVLAAVLNDPSYPDGTEVHVADFSPSYQLGQVKPIKSMLAIARKRKKAKDKVGVITARKGETEFDTFKGDKPKAKNKADIIKFMKDKNVPVDFAYGAADLGNVIPQEKYNLAKQEWFKSDASDFNFYDDDIKNAEKMADLCQDGEVFEKKPNADIAVYSKKHFTHGPGEPLAQCKIPSEETYEEEERSSYRTRARYWQGGGRGYPQYESGNMRMESLRRLIRNLILEKIEYAAFHGLGMDPNQMGGARFNGVSACSEPWKKDGVPSDVGCPAFTKTGNVKAEDITTAVEYLKEEQPEKLLVYSRGASVFCQALGSDKLSIEDVPKTIIFLAPAWKRWGTPFDKGFDKLNGKTVIVAIGEYDSKVPVKHALELVNKVGGTLNIIPKCDHTVGRDLGKSYSEDELKKITDKYGEEFWRKGRGPGNVSLGALKVKGGSDKYVKSESIGDLPEWANGETATIDQLIQQIDAIGLTKTVQKENYSLVSKLLN